MIEEKAIVTRIESGQAWIKGLQSGACGGCAQQAACGTATLTKILPKREFAVECDLKLNAGDQVVVAIDDAHLLLSSMLLYLLPLGLMFIGVGVANYLLPTALAEIWLPEIAIVSLLLAFALIHKLQTPLLVHFCSQAQIISKT